jgi:hypothetical protein
MDEEKITLPANKMRARNADFQSNGKRKQAFQLPTTGFTVGFEGVTASVKPMPLPVHSAYYSCVTAFLTCISLLSFSAGYPLSNKRAKRSNQEVKEQDWLGEKSYGSSSSSSPKKPVLASLLDVSKSPGSPAVTKGAAVATMDSELLLSMRTGAKRSSPAPDDEVDAPNSPATPSRGHSTKADRTVTTPGSMGEEAVKSSSFPERLMELFEGDVAKDAMWWLPGGDAFALSPDLFPDQVLQKYFQGTKFESFTRKLNRW